MERLRRFSTSISVVVLALVAYVPALASSPGRMPADSKLYVYLDPGRFLGDAATTFDPRQFAGWVPHQHIAYLWPTGPWFWTFEQFGVPDWIAHRLWIGTLLFVAGAGVLWMVRTVGFGVSAALAGALVYQLSPYVLPYISRTSVLLLPFAGLGWIVGCTVLAGRRGGWRYPALIALAVATVGAVNATALAMIIPAPALWLVHAVWERSIGWRRAVAVAARVALLSIGVSLWWIVALVVQGRNGADVLAYSESLESVSFTSTSTEVGRGLGYWLFYIRDVFTATTTSSLELMISGRAVLLSFAVAAVCVAGVAFVATPVRRFAGLLLAAGVVLGVGVHPIDDPSPFMGLLLGDGQGGLALALRSSTRAIPVLLAGFAIGAASLVTALGAVVERRRSEASSAPSVVRLASAGLVGLLAFAALPSARQSAYVDPAIDRDPNPPAHWTEATAALDALPDGYRVLQVPGTEFGAFEWGYTVDQPLPALTDRPVLTRDLLPLGSPAAMDLVFALDDRFQDDTFEVESAAPVARWLGADTVWVAGDVSFERFRAARPEVVTDQFSVDRSNAADLGDPVTYGAPVSVSPDVFPVIDAESLSDPRIGEPIAPITLVGVADPVPTVRVKDETVVVFGSADGLVDAAAAGVLDGSEAIVYAAGDEISAAVPVTRFVVTDSNRRRAHHWRSSQDVHGYTEQADGGVLRPEPADQRLPVFGDDGVDVDSDTRTVSVQRGPVTARASAYGEPFAYRPEDRAAMAIDGDPSTAWRVADRVPAVGEYIELTVVDLASGDPIEFVDLLQPATRPGERSISEVVVSVDGASADPVALGSESFVDDGQRIALPTPIDEPGAVVRIGITGTTSPQPPVADAIGAVGFAEIDLGLGDTVEFVRTPLPVTDLGAAVDASAGDVPIDVVLTRDRTDANDRWRSDPEPALRREVELARDVTVTPEVTLRFDRRLQGDELAAALGEPVAESARLTGAPGARGAAAFDDDVTTAWITPFVEVVGSAVTVSGDGSAESIEVEQSTGDEYSPVTRVRIDDGGEPFDVVVADGAVELPRPIDLDSVTVTVVEVDERFVLDRRYAEALLLPAAIAEIRFDGESPAVDPPTRIVADCRDDLLSIDGEPIGLSFDAALDDLFAGNPISAEVCTETLDLPAGVLDVESAPGSTTGFHVDRVVLRDVVSPDVAGSLDPTATVLSASSQRSRTVEVPPCPRGCWVIVGEGFNTAWAASIGGDSLGDPVLLDGNANGWWLSPSNSSRTVDVDWTAQRPLNIAFLLTILSVVASIVLVAWGAFRRRDHEAPATAASMESPMESVGWTGLGAVAPSRPVVGAGVVGALATAIFVDWTWGALAAGVVALSVLVRRPQVVAWLGWAVVVAGGLVVTFVVADEEPFPNAGWPVRFEYLHHWTLLGFLLVATGTIIPIRHARRGAGGRDEDRPRR